MTGDTGGTVTIDRLIPSTLYFIQMAAVNSGGELRHPYSFMYTSSESKLYGLYQLATLLTAKTKLLL